MAVLRGHRGPITSLVFHPDDGWLVSMDSAGWLRVWSGFVPAGLPGLPERPEGSGVKAGALAQPTEFLLEKSVGVGSGGGALEFRGKTLVVTLANGDVKAFSLKRGLMLRERWLAQFPKALAWSPDGAELAVTAGTDLHWIRAGEKDEDMGEIAVLKGAQPAGATVIPGSGKWGLALEEGYAVTASKAPSAVPAWKYAGGSKDTRGRVTGAAAADGGRMAVYSGRNVLFAGELKPDDGVLSLPPEVSGRFQDIVWDRGGRLLAVFTVETGENIGNNAEELIRATCWSTPGGGKAAAAGGFITTATSFASAEDGSAFFGRGVGGGLVRITPTRDGKGKTETLHSSPAARQDAPFAVSPDGKRIALAADRSNIHLINAATGEAISVFAQNGREAIRSLAWSPAGDRIAAVTAGGFVQIWDLTPWRAWLSKKGIFH